MGVQNVLDVFWMSWGLRAVQPRVSFTCLLGQSQVSGPWAHSQLALCRPSSQPLDGWLDSCQHTAALWFPPIRGIYTGWCRASEKWLLGFSCIYLSIRLDRRGSKLEKHGLSHVIHINMSHRQACVPHYLHQYNTRLDLEAFLKMTWG